MKYCHYDYENVLRKSFDRFKTPCDFVWAYSTSNEQKLKFFIQHPQKLPLIWLSEGFPKDLRKAILAENNDFTIGRQKKI